MAVEATDRACPTLPLRRKEGKAGDAAPGGGLLQACLFADADEAYAVLDGCRTPDLPRRLHLARAEHWCLLSDGLDSVLVDHAPYLVHLRRDAVQAVTVLRTCWGRHGGIALCPPAGSDGWSLREHLRAWLRVRGDDGRPRSFRFYDPGALLATLPTMPSERRNAFLAPLGRLYVEGAAPGSLVEFRRGECANGRALPMSVPELAQAHVSGMR